MMIFWRDDSTLLYTTLCYTFLHYTIIYFPTIYHRTIHKTKGVIFGQHKSIHGAVGAYHKTIHRGQRQSHNFLWRAKAITQIFSDSSSQNQSQIYPYWKTRMLCKKYNLFSKVIVLESCWNSYQDRIRTSNWENSFHLLSWCLTGFFFH